MATELIDFLGTRRAGAKTVQENIGLMERTPYTFHQLMGEPSINNVQTLSVPRKSEEPQLFIKVKEENENLRHRVDQLEFELGEEVKKVSDLERRKDRLHTKLE